MGSERPISGAYAGYQGPYFTQGMALGPMQGQARASRPASAPNQLSIPLFVTPSEPPRPPISVGEGSALQPLPDPLFTPTPTQPHGGGEIKPSGPAPGGPLPSGPAPIPTIPAQDERQPMPDPLPGRVPRTDEVQVPPQPTPAQDARQPPPDPSSGRAPSTDEVKVLPQPTPAQSEQEAQALEERLKELEARLLRLVNAGRREPTSNLFQSPAGPDYKVGQSAFKKPTPMSLGQQHPHPDRPRAGRSGSVDARLAKKWMREVKHFNPAKENFRAWLVKAELRMEESWDVEMRLNYLKCKLQLSEIVKLEQIIQLMDTQGTPRSWQAIRERALQVFPGAIDPDAAEFKVLAQQQDAGEPFGRWVDRVTELYIELTGEIPQPGLLDEVVFKGLRVEYKLEWRAMQPHNLLDARWRFTQLEQKKWQEWGLPNPAEGSGAVHFAASDGASIHSDGADLMGDEQESVFAIGEAKGQTPEAHQAGRREAMPQPQEQVDRSSRRHRRGSSRKPGSNGRREARRNSEERASRSDLDRSPEPRGSRSMRNRRSERRSGNRPAVKESRFGQREDRDDRTPRGWPSRPDWRRADQSDEWAQPTGWERTGIAGRGRQPAPVCGNCGRVGHSMRSCWDVVCFNCGRTGHLSRDCRAGRQRNEYRSRSENEIPAYAITPEVREDDGGTGQDAGRQAAPGGAPGSQRSPIDEVARTAKILRDQLQNMAEQRFTPIFPF